MKLRAAGFIRSITLVIAIALGSLRGIAQTPDPQPPGVASDPARPPLNPFPAEQNWSFLLDASKRTDFFDRAKYIPFHDNPQCYLSFGLEYRIEYEYFDNWMFGAGPQDHNGYVLNRVMPHFDLHAGRYFRFFTELKFDFTAGRNGGPRPGIMKTEATFIRPSSRSDLRSAANTEPVCAWAARKWCLVQAACSTTPRAPM